MGMTGPWPVLMAGEQDISAEVIRRCTIGHGRIVRMATEGSNRLVLSLTRVLIP